MKKALLIILLCFIAAVSAPLTINFQMLLKDSTGKPVQLNNESITFYFTGDAGVPFWNETITFNAPNGLVSAALGSIKPIDPVSFYAQNQVKVTVVRATGDTILSEPFNAVPYAFKSFHSDSAENAALLQGKGPADFLPTTFEAVIRQMISDSIASHPKNDPTGEISDTASILRAYAVAQDDLLKSSIRLEIRDSISTHPSIDPTGEISDTAQTLRSYSDNQINVAKSELRSEIGDSASIYIRDSLSSRFEIITDTIAHGMVRTIILNSPSGFAKIYFKYGNIVQEWCEFIYNATTGGFQRLLNKSAAIEELGFNVPLYGDTATPTKIAVSFRANGTLQIEDQTGTSTFNIYIVLLGSNLR